MKTHVALSLAVLAGLQVVSASFFDNVKPMKPNLPFEPSLIDGPLQNIFNVFDKSLVEPHIVGGKEVVPHSHPYQVALKIVRQVHGDIELCGGTLLSNEWVLTAAHCADGVLDIKAVLGAHNILEDEPTARQVEIFKTVIHPKYDKESQENDIALLRLQQRVELDGINVNTMRLPALSQKNEGFYRKDVTMTGWGRDSDNSENVSPVLREVDSYILSNKYCSFRYFFRFVKDTNICASGWWLKSFGICNGDSGGPLFLKEEDGEKTIIGISSFTSALGCEKTWPPIFTRVTSYLDWIHQTTGIPPRQ